MFSAWCLPVQVRFSTGHMWTKNSGGLNGVWYRQRSGCFSTEITHQTSDHQWSFIISITSYASDARLTYLNCLSELQVERNDARALQPGGEAGPPAAAFRAPRLLLLLVSGRIGTVKWVHHDRTKTAAALRITIRASITISGQKPERAPPVGQERMNPHTPLLEKIKGCRLLFIYFTSFYWFLLPVTPTNTSTQVWSLIMNKSLLSVTYYFYCEKAGCVRSVFR